MGVNMGFGAGFISVPDTIITIIPLACSKRRYLVTGGRISDPVADSYRKPHDFIKIQIQVDK